jgi:hypothetical protein
LEGIEGEIILPGSRVTKSALKGNATREVKLTKEQICIVDL